MSIAVPHKKNNNIAQKKDTYNDGKVSAYDIILGKVEIDTDLIPQYM